MYFSSVIIILWCVVLHISCRPSSVLEDYDKEAKDDSYEDSYKSDSENYFQNERKPILKKFPGSEPDSQAYLQGDDVLNTNGEGGARVDKEYLENSDESQAESTHLSRTDIMSANNDVKRTASSNKDNVKLLQNNNEQGYKTIFNNDEMSGSNAKASFFKKYNAIRNDDRIARMSTAEIFDNEEEKFNRDRRQIRNTEVVDVSVLSPNNEIDSNEDEETAIKRHIKKLSKREFDELLHSLSEDKRALLKNIMDSSQQESDGIKKREITKKAGANEENSFVGSEQADSDKAQGVSADIATESSTSDSMNPKNTKKEDGEMYSKYTEFITSSEKCNNEISALDAIVDTNLQGLNNKDNMQSLQAETKTLNSPNSEQAKNGNKREVNAEVFVDSVKKDEDSEILSPLNNEDLYCSENEDISQLWNEERNINKRDIASGNVDLIKSLEDSFPDVNDPSTFKAGSNIPLVRVKRKNRDKIVEKRDANFISNLKVPYFSNAVENNEEDNDDGEFQDDGFFDRRTNLAKSGLFNEQDRQDSFTNNRENHSKNSEHNFPVPVEIDNNVETSIVSLGSDTDAVLSGMEGVDDNIMYNSISRNRRTAEEFNDLNNENDIDKYEHNNAPKLVSDNENNETAEPCINAPRYQEKDTFGSLPRNYEDDLGRFKRVRRLKP